MEPSENVLHGTRDRGRGQSRRQEFIRGAQVSSGCTPGIGAGRVSKREIETGVPAQITISTQQPGPKLPQRIYPGLPPNYRMQIESFLELYYLPDYAVRLDPRIPHS